VDNESDGLGDVCDLDDDNAGVYDADEIACGADPLVAAIRPERTDNIFAGVDDDGDGQTDEPLPVSGSSFDCDGDGYPGSAEDNVFGAPARSDQDPCGTTAWSADFVSGGVPMLEALKITSSTANNILLETAILDARQKVSEGKSLTDSLKETGHFPFMLTQMVSVGEATGTLDEMLTKMADFYDEEVDASVSSLLSIMEPILMIGVGGLVGTLVISMYLPIFSLMQAF
jgi:hypothetical protein